MIKVILVLVSLAWASLLLVSWGETANTAAQQTSTTATRSLN